MPNHAPQKKSSLPPVDESEAALDAPILPNEDSEDTSLDDLLFAPDDSAEQEQIHELMTDYELEREDAERVSEIMDEYDLDPDDAISLDEEREGY